jgi:uncharacterized protein (DUF1697 family)
VAAYVALLRAVNLGGDSTLPMKDLVALCSAAGFSNVVFISALRENEARAALERQLLNHSGKAIGVLVRSASEMAETLALNPFADAPGNQVQAIFLDDPLPADPHVGATGAKDEIICIGPRVIYIFYPQGIGKSGLRIPAEKGGTARNMNTVGKLTAMAQDLG